ncbi:TRAP transporter small permease [Rhizobium sp. CSW-27]|uniref:TRAP transporter small permease n=1 Tax=Rhizobium sp. CSW-27 TaxID=2839985 RepID=UPI001C0250FE|nr:TRAP transporter small permease [Rhizobium sp. CSW-27]MBT9369922.1 TRAP transporter small permease [Rhizobium sp. CSW-27]
MRNAFAAIAGGCRMVTLASLLLLVVVTAIDVGGRVLFGSPLGFAYELIGVLLGLSVYAGLVEANRTRQHIRIDLADGLLARHPRLDRAADRLVWLLEFGFSLLLAVMVARQTIVLYGYQENFMFLPMPKWLPLAVVGGLLVTSLGSFAAHLGGDAVTGKDGATC